MNSNPFNFYGPEFLSFFLELYATCTLVALFLRYILRSPVADGSEDGSKLTPTQVAYLRGGASLAARAAIVEMVYLRNVNCDMATRRVLRGDQPLANEADPVQKAIYSLACSPLGLNITGSRFQDITYLMAGDAELAAKGYLLSDSRKWMVAGLSGAVAFIPVAVGVIKILIGISRERPVDILVLLTALAFFSAILFFLPPIRSRKGDSVLRQLKARFSNLRRVHDLRLPADGFGMAVALFGLGALSPTPLAPMTRFFVPPNSGGGGCGAASGCGGGGGCGGGSGCGGGGGCGGCGSSL